MKPDALESYKQMMNWYMNGRLEQKPSVPQILKDG